MENFSKTNALASPKSAVIPHWDTNQPEYLEPVLFFSQCTRKSLACSNMQMYHKNIMAVTIYACDALTYAEINSLIDDYGPKLPEELRTNAIRRDYVFYLDKTEKVLDDFLKFINFIDNFSPFGRPLLDEMSNCILGYISTDTTLNNKITKVGPIACLPILTLLIFKRAFGGFPDELIQTICLFIFQNLSIKFSESNTNEYYEKLSHQTLLEYRKPRLTINNSPEK